MAAIAVTGSTFALFVPARAHMDKQIAFPVIGGTSFSNDFYAARAGGTIHGATDIIANKGQEIIAVEDGKITQVVYPQASWGYSVSIKDAEGYTYTYIHMNNDNPGTDDGQGGAMHAYAENMKVGNDVFRGQLLGWVGDSGNAENTVSHCHFEMRAPDNTLLNPYDYLVAAPHIPTPVLYPQLSGEFLPYGNAFRGTISLAMGNFDADTDSEIVTGAGAGGGPHVRVLDSNNVSFGHDFMAYDPKFYGGIDVAAGDVDGDGTDEVVTGPGPGGGPNVKVWKKDGTLLSSFMAYDPKFLGGIKVAAGDVTGDGKAEVIVGPGAGGGPNVKVFTSAGVLLKSFMAYDPNFTGGIDVASADVTGTASAEIITAAGPGGGPHVRVFDGAATGLSSFMAYDPAYHGGVRVSAGNVNTGTAKSEILVGPASPPGGPHLRLLDSNGTSIKEGNFLESWWEGYYDVAAGNGTSLAGAGGNRRATVRLGLQ
jgi:hypothetical protein